MWSRHDSNRIARRAAGLFIALGILLSVVSGCARAPVWSPAEANITGGHVEIPIDLPAHGMPVVAVTQPGSSQKSFGIIDTGAGASMLRPAFASRNHLEERHVPDLQMRDALKQTRESTQVAHVQLLGIGHASFHRFDAVIDDLPVLAALSDQLEVVLARPLFRDVLLTIDYPRRKVSIELGALPEPNGRDVLPMRTDDRGHLLVPVNIGGDEAWLILDTGHTAQGVLLSRFRLIAMRWAATPVDGDRVNSFLGTTRSRIGRMNGSMTLGQYTFADPIVAIAYDDDREFLGADTLRHFIVTIDQKNLRVRFASPRTGPAATQPIVVPPVRRFGFDFTDAHGTVRVVPGSGAQGAGLQDGDRILAIDGVPLAEMTYLHQESMESSDHPLIIRIERGGAQRVLRVPLTTVVP